MPRALVAAIVLAAFAATVLPACDAGGETLTIYSGRKQEIVEPLLLQFEEESGIDLEIRYADSIDLAATIREEGSNSPADVFFAVDPASLGVVAGAGLFRPLPTELLARSSDRFADPDGLWVATSGRSRSVVYDTTRLGPSDLPADLSGFTDPAWRGRLGIAPTNGSFVASVAAMILLEGEAATLEWLQGIADNRPVSYPKNSVIVAAVDEGEIEAGLVNHYYPLRRRAETPDTITANHFLDGGAGALVMPAGAGVLASSERAETAEEFIAFLLSDAAQAFFAAETLEYPVAGDATPHPSLPALEDLNPPDLDLSQLAGTLDRATDLIAEAGLL